MAVVVLSLFCLWCYFGMVHSFQKYFDSTTDKYQLTVMSFNVWVGGDNVPNGLQKIVDHIKAVDPDIVALQEMDISKLHWIVNSLNSSEWNMCDNTNNRYANDPYIITRFSVVKQYNPGPGLRNVGCQVQIDPKQDKSKLNVWNWHLPAYPYGPYDICVHKTIKTQKEIETYGGNRLDLVQGLLKHDDFYSIMSKAHYEPLILAGDFNTPSHLDWVEMTRSYHCNWTHEWPVTKRLYEEGFLDSYRTIYPNPFSHAGVTWTPIYKYNDDKPSEFEPLDRIDMILYKGYKLTPVSSTVYDGHKTMYQVPNHRLNDWPSDHSSVVTEFEFRR